MNFENAVSKNRIIHSPLEDLKQVLKYVFVLVGLRANNMPVELEKAVLLEYIIENYGGHTPEEIKLAFKMAVAGKLKLEPKEVKCYENFSPLYFTTIMEAYREWALEQVKLLPAPVIQREPTTKELMEINLNYAFFLFKLINKFPIKIESTKSTRRLFEILAGSNVSDRPEGNSAV